eukprot:TRINITY_DN6017_c0_g1_i3.p1 TRINITY_DN6017_c0_g1~~TRINITY_DN6017_c0_g1_i3.p1  ORF type:complete len:281 (-),score=75.66 TRINITY_DN6017_c0_g1_i3:309-1151(-)
MFKQKVEEVKKLQAQVDSISEQLTVAQGYSSVIKDLERQVQDLQADHKVTLEELARAKVAASRVALAVANEWKDDNDKVIPVKQWLDERRFLLGESEKLREKLALAERASKFEAQMKEKAQLRLRVLEETLKPGGSKSTPGKGIASRPSLHKLPRQVVPVNSDSTEQASADIRKCTDAEDRVSGALYDLLQKEVIALRKSASERDLSIKDKDDAVEMLSKKVETLTKALDVETKKSRREIGLLEKELAILKNEPLGGGKSQRRTSAIGAPRPIIASTSAR